MFWFFGPEACGILAPRPGIEPTPPALDSEVLTTGLPGKSLSAHFLIGLFILMLSCMSSLNILVINPLLDISFHCSMTYNSQIIK